MKKRNLVIVLSAMVLVFTMVFAVAVLASEQNGDGSAPLPGDCNSDGVVDLKDVVLLSQYLASKDYDNPTDSMEIGAGADYNNDKKINLMDIQALRRFLAGVEDPEIPEPDVPVEPEVKCDHIIATSVYNETTGLYDQTCKNCDDKITSPINLLITPSGLKENFDAAKKIGSIANCDPNPSILEENGIEFIRYTFTKESPIYFYPKIGFNDDIVTGEYAVFKYRFSKDSAVSESWTFFAGTNDEKATSQDEKLFGKTTPIIDDGNWHIAIVKLSATKLASEFSADENGDYYANFVRFDIGTVVVGGTVDLEYVGFTEDLNNVEKIMGNESFGTDVFCTHYEFGKHIDLTKHSGLCAICGVSIAGDAPHTIDGDVVFNDELNCYIGTCSVCGGDASTPFNHYVDAEDFHYNITNAVYGNAVNLKSAEYFSATDDDIAFTRLTEKTNGSWIYFDYYENPKCSKVTGQYVVIKYRFPKTDYNGNSIQSYVGSATSPNAGASKGENITIVNNVTGTDTWYVAAYDMSKALHYGANEDGTYSAKYLRIDFYIDTYVDIAFIGVCDNLDAVEANIGNADCKHSIYNYDIEFTTHAIIDCALCHSTDFNTSAKAHTWSNSVYDEKLGGYVLSCTDCGKTVVQEGNNPLNLFMDAALIQKTDSASSGGNPFASSQLMCDETESLFVRFTGAAVGGNHIPMTVLINNAKPVNMNTSNAGHFLIVKYRYSKDLSLNIKSARLYVSSVETPTANEDVGITVSVSADGEWHYIILDLNNVVTKEGFSGENVTLLRFHMYSSNVPADSDYLDFAYVGITDNIDDLRNFDDDYDTYGLVGSSELKNAIGAIATENVDTEHNDMSYVTLTGSGEKNYSTLYKSDAYFSEGTGKFVAILYRKDSSTSSVKQCRMYFSKNNDFGKYYFAPYVSDGKWHLTVFDMSQDEEFCDGIAKTIRFDWFNFSSATVSIDVAYVKFFDSMEDVYAFYNSYVAEYLDQENCDHVITEWKYGSDNDPNTDKFMEYAVCKQCGKQTDDARDVGFSVTLDKVTDSNGTYPEDYSGTIGSAEDTVVVFNSTKYNALYPVDGLKVADGDEISIAGVFTFNGEIDSVWYKIFDASGNDLTGWKECKSSIDGNKFAAYADFNGISESNLKVTFAIVPAGLPEEFTDRYLPIVTLENVTVDATVEKKSTFNANNELGTLMDNVFEGNYVMNETVMFLDYGDSKTLLYDIDEIISVKSYDGTITYTEGVDYALVDGKIVILEGSSIPCITSEKYYNVDKAGLTTYNKDGEAVQTYWGEKVVTDWQVNVEYKHSDKWNGYVQDNQSDYFADFIEKLMNGEDVTIFFYGDSITAGANSSFLHGYAQQQYSYSLLVTNALADAFGYTVHYVNTYGLVANMGKVPTSDYVAGTRGTITYINTAVGSWQSVHGLNNFNDHVKNYIENYGCDLFICAFGMNNLGTPYNTFISEIKGIVDQVYALAPDTSVMLISTMFRNNTETVASTRMEAAKGQDERLTALAEEYRNAGHECGITHMTLMSESILTRKDFMDYTGNNVNHPNDFFGRIYAQTVFEALIGYENLAD